jgi:NAD(P)-dependent dehydrogenase (short-subunit alcohol dehydrogenase family)
MDLELAGKRALVTGASRGIGLAVARELAREGARVVLAARDPTRLDAAATALAGETGAEVHGLTVETGEDTSVRRLVEGVVARLGGLDILVNAAATTGPLSAPPKLAQVTDEAFWNDVNVKVMGYLRCARQAAPHMAAQGWGRIINLAGLGARMTGWIVGSIRNVSVAALTKNLADELGPSGINVTVVHPGLTPYREHAGRDRRQRRRLRRLAGGGRAPDQCSHGHRPHRGCTGGSLPRIAQERRHYR